MWQNLYDEQAMLQRIIDWCERHLEDNRKAYWQHVTLPSQEVLDATKKEITQLRKNQRASGEYKRDQCYKTLIRQFPTVPRSHIALGIEVIYQHD